MDLDLHLLELSFEALRKKDATKEKRLMASIAQVGQQLPIVVVQAETQGLYVVVDGYKRVRALRKLRADTVCSTLWALSQADALVLERLMRTADSDGPLEQGWLLVELRDRFGISQNELARRFDKSQSWVSRRIALVSELPDTIQKAVRDGGISPHIATKILVPMARAKPGDASRLAAGMERLHVTSRDAHRLYAGYLDSGGPGRQLILDNPELFLRAEREAAVPPTHAPSPIEQLTGDLGALGGIARRAHRRVSDGRLRRALTPDRKHIERMAKLAQHQSRDLFDLIDKEIGDAGSEPT